MKRCGWIVAASALAVMACSSSDNQVVEEPGDTGGTQAGSGGAGGGAPGAGGTVKKDGGSGGTTGGSGGAKPGDSGSGSGGSIAPPPDGGKLSLGADGKLTTWTIGDSITNNTGWRDRMCTVLTGQKYKPWFVGSLGSDGGTCNNGRNDGHSGFGIADILNGKDNSGTVDDWYNAFATKPQVATLMIGTNNVAWWVADGTLMSDIADECIGLLDHILSLDPNMVVLVGTIPPESSQIIQTINRDRADLANEYNAALKQKVPQHAQYGKRVYLADTNNGLVFAGNVDTYDGIHLSGPGNTKVGDTWLSVLTPLLPPP